MTSFDRPLAHVRRLILKVHEKVSAPRLAEPPAAPPASVTRAAPAFSNVQGADGNRVSIAPDALIGDGSSVEFLTFFNGSGGEKNSVSVGSRSRLRGRVRISIRGVNNHVVFEDEVAYTGSVMIAGAGLRVVVGHKTTINGAQIVCREKDILIGAGCLISNEVKIRSSDTHKIFDGDSNARINAAKRPVTIGDKVWIGQGSFIGKNAGVPSGCVVGARSLVTRELTEENAIIAGQPATVVRSNIRWEP